MPRAATARTGMSAAERANRFGRGFTLLELLVVLAILTLALTLVLPRLDSTTALQDARRASWELAAILKKSRAQAIRTGRETGVVIDLKAREVRFGHDQQRSLAESLALKLLTGQRADDRRASDARIGFFPDGSSTGGRITLHDGRQTYVIGVEWLNGRVEIAEGNWTSGS